MIDLSPFSALRLIFNCQINLFIFGTANIRGATGLVMPKLTTDSISEALGAYAKAGAIGSEAASISRTVATFARD